MWTSIAGCSSEAVAAAPSSASVPSRESVWVIGEKLSPPP
jgi:hypothetical protein